MIPLERLAAHALGDLEGDDARAVDEHVLACGECAAKLERLLGVAPAVRELVAAGRTRLSVPPALLERLRRDGLVSRGYRIPRGGVVPCSVGADDLYTLVELEADLAGVGRVDVVKHRTGARVVDVPYDRARGIVAWIEPCEAIRRIPSGPSQLTLLAVDGEGERALGTYTLDHTAPDRST